MGAGASAANLEGGGAGASHDDGETKSVETKQSSSSRNVTGKNSSAGGNLMEIGFQGQPARVAISVDGVSIWDMSGKRLEHYYLTDIVSWIRHTNGVVLNVDGGTGMPIEEVPQVVLITADPKALAQTLMDAALAVVKAAQLEAATASGSAGYGSPAMNAKGGAEVRAASRPSLAKNVRLPTQLTSADPVPKIPAEIASDPDVQAIKAKIAVLAKANNKIKTTAN